MTHAAESLHLKIRWKCRQNPESCGFKSLLDSQNDRGRVKLGLRYYSSDSDWWIGDEKSVSRNDSKKIFGSSGNVPGRTSALTFMNWLKMVSIVWNVSITGDEPWIIEYGQKTMRQSMERHTSTSSRSKIVRMRKSQIKCILFCFSDS